MPMPLFFLHVHFYAALLFFHFMTAPCRRHAAAASDFILFTDVCDAIAAHAATIRAAFAALRHAGRAFLYFITRAICHAVIC